MNTDFRDTAEAAAGSAGSPPAFQLVVYRFTTDGAAMARFVELLGLRGKLRSADGGFRTFRGTSGALALHPVSNADTGAAPGESQLSFEAWDIDSAARWLSAAGLDSQVWDEAYGRVLSVHDPHGHSVWVNEVQHDLYGFEHLPSAGPPDSTEEGRDIDIVAVRPTPDFEADTRFYRAFGFTSEAGSPGFQPLQASGERGTIGLHEHAGPAPRGAGEPETPMAACWLGFSTGEDASELASRLQAGGHDSAIVVEEEHTRRVEVTDPDGQKVEIHQRVA